MSYYKNLNGNSGVRAYEAGGDYIKVQFADGAVYLYNYGATGASNVEQMKRLAATGSGLNSFINTHVRKAYARKL